MKENKRSPRGSSIVTSHSGDSGVSKDRSEGFSFKGNLKFWNLVALIIEKDELRRKR